MEELQVSKFLLWLKKRDQRLPDRLVVQCRAPVCPCLAWPTRYKTRGQFSLPVGAWDNMGRYSCSLSEPLRVLLPEGCLSVKVKLRKCSHTVATMKTLTGETFCTSTRASIGVLFYRVGREKGGDDGEYNNKNLAGAKNGDDDTLASEKCDDDTLASEKCDDDSLASEKCCDENLAGAKCDDGILGVRARRMTFDEKYEVLDEEDYLEDPSTGDSDSSGWSEDLAIQEDDDSPGHIECFYAKKYEKSFLTEETVCKRAARMYDTGCLAPKEYSDALDHMTLLLAVGEAAVMFLIPWAYHALLGPAEEEDEPLIDL